MVMKEKEITVTKKVMMEIMRCMMSTMASDIKFPYIKYFNYSNY
jgi:hypothetical protein